ncbi:MAG: vitamin B12-dependent ribonucleotide reductase, partial [Deltaproteobacteria bacterium]|nr:vitamin B12-dependent ribonucleotide reductase [Deltaproteobacteria bacterium]
QTATNIVASKYFRGQLGSPEREQSVRVLVSRVVGAIVGWAEKQGYFSTAEDLSCFSDELTFLLVNQKAAFNSPVWFNVGIEERPQAAACFINSVDDTMGSILGLAKTEGMLFKFGSGTGSNLSRIRSSTEPLAGGGTASGPVSFMRGYDAFAGVIKSGGKTRRAAKMVILDAWHPDILEFINCKADEERKAWALIDAGYEGAFNVKGGAYDSVFFQNANHAVRLTDDFMRAVVEDGEWQTHQVLTKELCATHKARELMRLMAQAAWQCGDPGVQFDTTINDWHTCPGSGRINASNPCSEYMFLDDTACNLASLNLMLFRTESGELDIDSFNAATRTMITAQEILVDNASYPTPAIDRNSHDYRPLGLGYANLGVLLMDRGLPYDSDAGRAHAAAITALMHGEAYSQSARIAAAVGPFPGYARNAEPMLRVIDKHRQQAHAVDPELVSVDLLRSAQAACDEAYALGVRHGYRNAQATVLAPTGTIGFMMDCDTTGIEPDIALVKYKKLVGGGMMKIVNQSVPGALAKLGYTPPQVEEILAYVEDRETIEGAPHLRAEHLAIFDCAFRPVNGERSIHYMGHIKMMAAVQPFLSGAISKTVNLPSDSQPDDIARAYTEAWRLGLKAVAVYRDGCKRSQPLSTGKEEKAAKVEKAEVEVRPARLKLPDER